MNHPSHASPPLAAPRAPTEEKPLTARAAWAFVWLPRAGYPLLLVLLSLVAIGPALGSGYWWGAHDARHSVYFLFEFDQAIRDGILWPRWSPDLAFGYGYPLFNVYGPLAYYVGEAFHLLGFSMVSAVKASFALSLLLSGLAMYGFARRLIGANGALVAAVAYLFLPYHLADLYVRAALAESWAFVWFPLVFWGFYECATRPRPRAIALTALAYACFFLSHNGLAMQTTFILLPWILLWLLAPVRAGDVPFWRGRAARTVAAGAAGGLGLMLGGIFIFPWLLEYNDVDTEQWFAGYFSFSDHFVQLWQFFSPTWGFGISEAGAADTFPFQLGLVPLLFAAAGWAFHTADHTVRRACGFFTLMLVVFLFLMVEPSRFIWESPLGFILQPAQFPWRLLIFAGFALSFLAGLAALHAPRWATLLLALLLVAGSYPYARAETMPPAEGPVSHASLMRFQQSSGEMTGQSRWAEEIPTWSDLADVWVGGGDVTSRFAYGDLPEGAWAGNAVNQSNQEVTEVQFQTPATARWMITYYPGWRAYQLPLAGDGAAQPLPITPATTTGHLTVQAPAGHYRLLVRFEDTPVRVVGTWLSAFALLVVMALLFLDRRVVKSVPAS